MKVIKFEDTDILNENVSMENVRYNSNNIITEVLVAILLVEPTFLDSALDAGLDKYSNSSMLMNDLKTYIFNAIQTKDTRLSLGNMTVNGDSIKVSSDNNLEKINNYFKSFVLDLDGNAVKKKLKSARDLSRNILDKVKDNGNRIGEISKVYWLSPMKPFNSDIAEDFIIEDNSGNQYSVCVSGKLSNTNYMSLNSFMDTLIGTSNYNEIHIYQKDPSKYNYGKNWDKIVQEYMRVIYKYATQKTKDNLANFVDENTVETVNWFDFFNIKIADPKYKYLGQYFDDIKKHCKFLRDYLNEIHKTSSCFHDYDKYLNEWEQLKTVILKSRILEHMINASFKKYLNLRGEIEQQKGSYKKIKGNLKMKLTKMFVESLGCEERTLHYVERDGYTILPDKQFFRDRYDDLDVWINYHIPVGNVDEISTSEIAELPSLKVIIYLDKKILLKLNYIVDFKLGSISESLKVKIRKDFSATFNNQVTI